MKKNITTEAIYIKPGVKKMPKIFNHFNKVQISRGSLLNFLPIFVKKGAKKS